MTRKSRAVAPLAALGIPIAILLIAITMQLDGGPFTVGGGLPARSPTSAPTPDTTLRPTPDPAQPIAGASASPAPSATATPAPPLDPATQPHPALAALATIPTATSAALWYERSAFGAGWGDPDRNGCDARNDVLARDLDAVAFRPGTHDCVVVSGTLHDPYTGATIHFVRGNDTSQAVQIDHVVPLAWAWRYGASAWSDDERARFHNDQLNLLAVDGPTNMQKSDAGPARWMPARTGHHCAYADQFVTVVATYRLAMPADDRAVLETVLARC